MEERDCQGTALPLDKSMLFSLLFFQPISSFNEKEVSTVLILRDDAVTLVTLVQKKGKMLFKGLLMHLCIFWGGGLHSKEEGHGNCLVLLSVGSDILYQMLISSSLPRETRMQRSVPFTPVGSPPLCWDAF